MIFIWYNQSCVVLFIFILFLLFRRDNESSLMLIVLFRIIFLWYNQTSLILLILFILNLFFRWNNQTSRIILSVIRNNLFFLRRDESLRVCATSIIRSYDSVWDSGVRVVGLIGKLDGSEYDGGSGEVGE